MIVYYNGAGGMVFVSTGSSLVITWVMDELSVGLFLTKMWLHS